jgi:hypothetical protein
MRMLSDDRTKRWGEIAALSLVAGAYVVLKAATLCVTIGDQSLYFYASFLWTEGVMPYRDFFLSHPPVHLLVSAVAILVAGTNLNVLLALPSLFGLLNGLLTYAIARRAFGIAGALIAAALFLFSLRHLLASSYFTGVNVATFWLLGAVLLTMRGRPLLAGLSLGLGVATGAYVAVGAFVLILLVGLKDRPKAVVLGVAFLLTAGLINLAFFAVAGWAFIDQVYGYHLAKSAESAFFSSKAVILQSVLNDSWPLAVLAACAVPAALLDLARPRPRRGGTEDAARRFVLALSVAMLLGHAAFLLLFQRIFTHYFLLPFPFVVLLGVDLLVRLLRWRPAASARPRRGYAVVAWLLVGVLLTGVGVWSVDRFRQERVLRCFDGTQEIADYVAETLREDETFFGDYGIVPLLALASQRRIAANEIESNIMRYESGITPLDQVLDAIARDNVSMVVTRQVSGLTAYPPFQRYLTERYVLARRFAGSHSRMTIDVWRRRR